MCFGKEKARGYNNELAEGLKGINFLGQCLHLVIDSHVSFPPPPLKISRDKAVSTLKQSYLLQFPDSHMTHT